MSLKLEVGEFYLSASGSIVEIDHFNEIRCRYYDKFDNEYLLNGKYLIANPHNKDLIAHIPKELHYKIVDIVKDYYAFPMIRNSINNSYRKRNK